MNGASRRTFRNKINQGFFTTPPAALPLSFFDHTLTLRCHAGRSILNRKSVNTENGMIELLVERPEWTLPAPRYSADTLGLCNIGASDLSMRLQANAAGGRWNPGKRLWFVKFGKIAGTSLEKHLRIDEK